jgi:tetratricopeptide (TPR) repeat protein
MKKRFLLAVLSFLFLAGTAFVVLKNTNRNKLADVKKYGLLPRKASLSYTSEWEAVKNNAAALNKKIEKNNADIKSMIALSGIYMQEARVTGNYAFYNEASMQQISSVLEKDPENFEALSFKATILLSKHQFEEAIAIAEQLKQKFPYNAYVYGMLVDANVELGNYEAAIEAADKMISIRPDIRSYSRIAYLREIHGDIPGAIDAMKMAITAGAPGDENTEWCRVQTGKLYEQWGKLKEAEMEYRIALNNRENYSYALAGLARIATTQKDYTKAISLFQQADSIIPDHTFKEGIAEVYELTGENEKASALAADILTRMKELSKVGNEDHEMAHAYVGVKDYDKALEYALKEYNRRPGNIEANETVAMVYAAMEDYSNALPFIERALSTNNKNPELVSLATLIKEKAGKK